MSRASTGSNLIEPDAYDGKEAAVAVGNHDNVFVASSDGNHRAGVIEDHYLAGVIRHVHVPVLRHEHAVGLESRRRQR